MQVVCAFTFIALATAALAAALCVTCIVGDPCRSNDAAFIPLDVPFLEYTAQWPITRVFVVNPHQPPGDLFNVSIYVRRIRHAAPHGSGVPADGVYVVFVVPSAEAIDRDVCVDTGCYTVYGTLVLTQGDVIYNATTTRPQIILNAICSSYRKWCDIGLIFSVIAAISPMGVAYLWTNVCSKGNRRQSAGIAMTPLLTES